MTWQLASFLILGLGLTAGFAWYERSRPSARVLALVAALAALAVVGRLAFAAFPNVKPTTDIVLIAGYSLGGAAGFAVGAITPVASNVFLGHGPWTPWQMAAWGLVGVGGALLARTTRGRELSRWSLAVACAVAGVLFGLIMDTYQWTLAAEQDLGTWLAVSASSLPYNIAHIVGNIGFCLLIGPGLVRALARFRRRFEVRWAPAAASAAVLLLLVAPASASAASAASRAAGWLERAQNTDGGFGSDRGGASGQLFTGWASLGLAAAGHNPRDVERSGRSPIDYIRRNARQIRDVGEIERTILVLEAAGLSSRSFGGRDFVARLERFRRSDGSFSGFVSYTAFGILALRSAGEGGTAKPVRWLAAEQNEDGGWGLTPAASSDVDITAAALQALASVGRGKTERTEQAAAFLRRLQNPDGGFRQTEGRSSNAQSTSYAVQALVAIRRDPTRFRRAGRSPLGYLRALQRSDGRVGYSRISEQTPVWVTAQAAMAFARKPLPLATVPRERTSRPAGAAPDGAGATPPPGAKAEAAKRRSTKRRSASKRKEAPEAGARDTAGVQAERPPREDGWTAYAPLTSSRDPGPQWLGVAISVAAAVLAAWAGLRWRRQRERRTSAPNVSAQSSATTP